MFPDGSPKLATFAEKLDPPAIQGPSQIPNPYRTLVRRRFSEPLLVLLLFVFGVWLWDHHVGHPAGFEPGAAELALRKADRRLRLAEGTAHLPPGLRTALGIESLPATIDTSVRSLETLAREGALSASGAHALAILIPLQQEGNPAAGPFEQLGLPGPPPPGEVLTRIIQGSDHWWDLPYLQGLGLPETEAASKLVESRTRHLTSNTIKALGTVLALALGGLVFLPGTLLAFFRAAKRPEKNYSGRWTLNFGLGVFLLAYLASIGFELGLDQMFRAVESGSRDALSISMPAFIGLDAISRFIPPLIALAFLFRRARHAVSRLGLAGPLDGRMVLGCFSLLVLIDFALRLTLDRSTPPNPTGGLSLLEAGPAGLAFAIISACFVAPIAEEILYRGVLFRSLANRIPLLPAVLISSVLFALVHFYTLPGLIAVAAVGATCALAYTASRSLLTAIALHALYNAAIKIPEWIVYQSPLS